MSEERDYRAEAERWVEETIAPIRDDQGGGGIRSPYSKHYPFTRGVIRFVLLMKYPEAFPVEDLRNGPNNILWMIDQIEIMGHEMLDLLKARGWIGWILAICEQVLLLFSDDPVLANAISRELMRRDVKKGLF